jgi:hypothetical protein
LNFTDALALLRRMDHSTLHDWVIAHFSPCSFHPYTSLSPTLAPTTYAFPIFCLRMVQKIKKSKKNKILYGNVIQ